MCTVAYLVRSFSIGVGPSANPEYDASMAASFFREVLQSSIRTVAPGLATGSKACRSFKTPEGVCSPSMLSKSQR